MPLEQCNENSLDLSLEAHTNNKRVKIYQAQLYNRSAIMLDKASPAIVSKVSNEASAAPVWTEVLTGLRNSSYEHVSIHGRYCIAQSRFVVLLTQAEGNSAILQRVTVKFEYTASQSSDKFSQVRQLPQLFAPTLHCMRRTTKVIAEVGEE